MGYRVHRYPSEPLESLKKAQELRLKYFQSYAEPDRLRWTGCASTPDSVPAGLGEDVIHLGGEPYGASIALDHDLAVRCQEAVEARGWSRDLCAYFRNYLGSMYLDEYRFGGPFPRIDFCFSIHICCTHGKWYQAVAEYQKKPYFCFDFGVGQADALNDNKVDFVVAQLHEAIEGMAKATGREYRDDLLIEAVKNDFRMSSTWAEICALNKHIPAPLDEDTMRGIYVLYTLDKSRKEFADLYDEVRDEIKDRVARGIAALPEERCRLLTDNVHPYHFTSRLFRYLASFGAVSVGNPYMFGLAGVWEDQPDGSWGPARTPMEKGINIDTRDQALRLMVEWNLRKPVWEQFYDPQLRTEMLSRIAKEWRLNGVILHYNRGCEGLSLGIPETRLGLMGAGIPVMTYEGNMADEREFDETRTLARIDSFMAMLGLSQDSQDRAANAV
ncbi:MAG: benzoyl-CoA reductase, bzd-type, subunit O [Dehalococcoidia bacterium]|nr:benzoyl-CoA reductase, bzd-type, subunit O [Dehalococcoidia bacterium]